MKMKKNIALTIVFLAALAAAFIVSCKKDDNKTVDEPQARSVALRQFELPTDIDGYLTVLKQRLVEGDNGAPMGVDEAAWHLAALANYDFGYFNAEHNNLLKATLYGSVKITNGQILFPDLAEAYASIHETIESYYQKLDLDNKKVHFVDVIVSEEGVVTLPITVTYSDRHYDWHLADTTYCNAYFVEESYPSFGDGMFLLDSVLNLIESFDTIPSLTQDYAVPCDYQFPDPTDYIDPDGSPNFINSRIYCTKGSTQASIPNDDMCYYLQSYHALGDTILHYSSGSANVIAAWAIDQGILGHNPHIPFTPTESITESIMEQPTYYHRLKIVLGVEVHHAGGPNQ